ncbi:MAG: polyamine aminopropyltransferase [Myxococcota bacterium]|jgi:spermidine synthase|nr:polyamine aminopropyltransferase [Myxococcota bacterium]
MSEAELEHKAEERELPLSAEEAEAREEEEETIELDDRARFHIRVLLLSILLVALCSITYELIIGTVSSYLLGNSVYQFSLTIGLYMSAMGVGSYLSKFVKRNLLENFFWVELSVGVLGGISSALLFGVFTFTPYFQPAMWIITLGIGTLVGLEIPLLTRYVRRYAHLREALANVLSWDYIGALLGSLAFPLLLLPVLGLLNSAAVVGLINVAVAGMGLYAFRKELKNRATLTVGVVLAAILLGSIFFTSGAYERFLDKRLFQDPVVYREQTPYQKLTMTAWRGKDFRLYINGNIQFSSVDEYRYHEALVHVPMSLVPDVRKVLILGGGDGLVVKQIRDHYPKVEEIVMVDLDPRMTELAKTHPTLRRINGGSMDDKRLEVVNDDAMNYVMDTKKQFDVIIIDLPDPNNESLSKLYSVEFYRLIRNRLQDNGVMVTQSSAVYFAPNSFWSIHRTIEAAFCPDEKGCAGQEQHVVPYHTWIPSFGDWGFNLASKNPLEPAKWKVDVPEAKYVDTEGLVAMLHFPRDVSEREVKINRLIEPVLLTYYINDWHKNNQ